MLQFHDADSYLKWLKTAELLFLPPLKLTFAYSNLPTGMFLFPVPAL